MLPQCYQLNGQILNHIENNNRGFQYADGFFTSIRIVNGQAQLWQYHHQRIVHSADALFLTININEISLQTQQLAKKVQQGVLKIHITRKPCMARGYGTNSSSLDASEVLFFTFIDSNLSQSNVNITPEIPMQAAISVTCFDGLLGSVSPRLTGLKTLARTEQVLASKTLSQFNENNKTAYSEALLFETNNNLIEAISSNVFYQLKKEKTWYTPPLKTAGVAGTMRAFLLDTSLPIEIADTLLSKDQLANVQSLFLTNAIKGIIPVVSLRQYANVNLAFNDAPVRHLHQQLVATTQNTTVHYANQ